MKEIKVIENNGQRVLTTAQIAELYETTEKRISNNFNENKNRYVEGKHYYCLIGDDLRDFKNESRNSGIVIGDKVNKLYLWTEKGLSLIHI